MRKKRNRTPEKNHFNLNAHIIPLEITMIIKIFRIQILNFTPAAIVNIFISPEGRDSSNQNVFQKNVSESK